MENNRMHLGLQKASGGFTLVELMIAMAVGGIVMAAVMTAFLSQHRSYLAQDDVVEMQQNVRVAVDMLVRDIRLAGYNPTSEPLKFTFVDGVNFSNGSGDNTAVSTNSSQISFTADRDGDGTVDRAAEDVNGDGVKDMSDMEQIAFRLSGTTLQRYSTVTGFIKWQEVAENIEQLEFYYTLSDGTETIAPSAAELAEIRSVQISILAVAGRPDQNFTNTMTYYPASNPTENPLGTKWGPFNDNLRRRLLITTVQCRNLGL
jgi:type IV pilus assembly protein PilW